MMKAMEPVEKLYGWDDGKLCFMTEEHGQLCVSDEQECPVFLSFAVRRIWW